MRWVTGLLDRASRLSTFQRVGDGLRSRTFQTPPHAQQVGIVADRAIYYPQLFDDLGMLVRLLKALHDDLTSASDTVARHSQGLSQLTEAMQTLSNPSCPERSPDQFIVDLEGVFKRLSYVEDELTASPETIALHGFKLQNLDLATQLLVEVFAEVVMGGGDHSGGASKLQRLRLACEKALSAKQRPPSSRKLPTPGVPNPPRNGTKAGLG